MTDSLIDQIAMSDLLKWPIAVSLYLPWEIRSEALIGVSSALSAELQQNSYLQSVLAIRMVQQVWFKHQANCSHLENSAEVFASQVRTIERPLVLALQTNAVVAFSRKRVGGGLEPIEQLVWLDHSIVLGSTAGLVKTVAKFSPGPGEWDIDPSTSIQWHDVHIQAAEVLHLLPGHAR